MSGNEDNKGQQGGGKHGDGKGGSVGDGHRDGETPKGTRRDESKPTKKG